MAEDAKTQIPSETAFRLERQSEYALPTAVLALDASPGGETLFAACFDGGVFAVNGKTGQHERLVGHGSYASGVQYARNKGILISSGYDGALKWYNWNERREIRTVQAHQFWSWQLHLSRDEKRVASSTGQYLAGGYKYEPAQESEPSVKVYDVDTGELQWAFSHVPPVQAVAFSHTGRFLAAGNMMGEVRVWNLESGKQVASWTTSAFTSWGIIKSHHYCGGIFDLAFSPDETEIMVCGMGPMIDPMAGNGKQRWQRFQWQDGKSLGQSQDSQCGNGLMETLQFHPSQPWLAMGGRLVQGNWNLAFFNRTTGALLHSLDTKVRITDLVFTGEKELVIGGAVGQGPKKDGKCPDFGRIQRYSIS